MTPFYPPREEGALTRGKDLADMPLNGLHILVLEDEFLIAMDLEQLCRDHGAAEITISRSLDQFVAMSALGFDAAIVDLRLAGVSTLDFAGRLVREGIPFVFATGLGATEETARLFPGTPLVAKPYAGEELVATLAEAVVRGRRQPTT